MKILLIGYGKMGKTIEQIAVGRGHTIAGRIDLGDNPPFPQADVAIEFTQPEAAPFNIRQCFDQKIPVVSGTTGWLDQKEEVDRYGKDRRGTLFYASNYSLGVNIFFKLNAYLASIMDRHPEYNVTIDETHHTQKKDAPSGTAITLAKGILKTVRRKKRWSLANDGSPDTLLIQSHRVDPAPGTHIIQYRSAIDDIEIAHTAHSREGFATGAVMVAEWLVGKEGIFSMDDFLKF